jgi:hypothetical protein
LAAKNRNKKRKNPLIRITAFIILILIIGFFIFYAIDNPGFLQGIFGRQQEEEPEKTEASPGDDGGTLEHTVSDMQEEPARTEPSLWQKVIVFFRDKFDPPIEQESYPSRLAINIYFAQTGEEKILAAEKRTVIAGNPGNALKGAMEELLKGPLQDYHYPVIPAGTELLGSRAADGVAEIDLSGEFLDNALDNRILDEYIIYSIVNTVTEIPDIRGVIFFLEGRRITTYGNMDLSIPLIHNQDLLEVSE